MIKLNDTPIERYELPGKGPVFVKREDLCCPDPGPPFSKIRGIYQGIAKLRDQGIEITGYSETKVSMASWGVAWACQQLGGIRLISFVPNYKTGLPPLLAAHRERWEALGGMTRLTKPNRGQIIHNRGKTELKREFGTKAVMLPMGLPFNETLEATAGQVLLAEPWSYGSVTVAVGSGVICSGVLRGIAQKGVHAPVYGIAIRHYDHPQKKRQQILERAGLFGGLLFPGFDFKFVNTNYEYLDFIEQDQPFPCNKYYDAKAWQWLVDNYDSLEKPILFWNIGSSPLGT